MRKIYNILFALLSVVALAACSNDVDEVFDKPSAQRANEAVAEYKTVLCSAENGWLMKYYPKENTQYGGYNVLLKFDESGNVTAMSDVYGSDVEATSHYTLGQSAGIVLSFDEYNKVFHFFSDPVNPAGVGKNGKGMEGDLEFRVLTATPDSVVMLGKKRGAKIVMTPMAKDTSWGETIDQFGDLADEMNFPKYSCEVNGASYLATTSYRTITFTRLDADEDLVTEPYIVTDKGIEFYEPISLNGVSISGFNYVGGDNFEFDSADGSIKMFGIVPPISEQVTNGDWFFSVANMGSFSQTYWNVGNEYVSQYYSPCYYAALTTSSFDSYSGHWGIIFNVAGYGSFIDLKPTIVDDDHISLACLGKFGLNGQYFYNWGQVYMIYALTGDSGKHAAGVSKTYKTELVSGTAKNPTAIKLTDENNPDNWYIITSDMPDSPF